jgi:hypothetical protein
MDDEDRAGDLSGHQRRGTRICRRKRRNDLLPGYAERRYLVAASWTSFPPVVKQPTLEARAGYRIFNGDGTGTTISTSSVNGVITTADAHADLSYTVKADCTGTYTVLVPGGPTVEIFVAPNGEEFVAIETSNGRANDAFSGRRVGPE